MKAAPTKYRSLNYSISLNDGNDCAEGSNCAAPGSNFIINFYPSCYNSG